MPAFHREVLIDYASNMICFKLNNCTIFWKQREFLHGFDNLQNRFPVGPIRTFIFSFFVNENFSRDKEATLLRFMGCLVKAKTLVSGSREHDCYHHSYYCYYHIIVFTKQPSADRYLANLFFTNNFLNF